MSRNELPRLGDAGSPGSIGWWRRCEQEQANMHLFRIQQIRRGMAHTIAWPASGADAAEYGIDAHPEDLKLKVIWTGWSTIWKDGKRKLVVLLPVNYPRESPSFWIEGLRQKTYNRMQGNYRACLHPDWKPWMSIAGLLSEMFQTYVADIDGHRPLEVA